MEEVEVTRLEDAAGDPEITSQQFDEYLRRITLLRAQDQ